MQPGRFVEHEQLLGLGSASLLLCTFGWQLRALWRTREVAGLSPGLIGALSGGALALGAYALATGEIALALVNVLVCAVGGIVLMRWRELARA